MATIGIEVRVGGQLIPVSRFEVTGGCYGSIGHVEMHSSISAMIGAGIDLVGLTGDAAGVEVTVAYSRDGAALVRLFGGEFLTSHFRFDHDEVEIRARSYAGVLADQRRTLTTVAKSIVSALKPLVPGQTLNAKGISAENQKVGQIVTAIAQEFGFTPIITGSTGSSGQTVGAHYGDATAAFMPMPQSLWEILVKLAQDTGFEIYDTPNKELVLGVPGDGPPIRLSFNQSAPASDAMPCRDLVITHSPRRNKTFRVLVFSYDPATKTSTLGTSVMVGTDYAGSTTNAGRKVKSVGSLSGGLQSGPSAASAEKQIAKLNVGSNVIPLYTFHFDGLTSAQAQAKADAVATDIAKRQLTLDCEVDVAAITPTSKVNVTGSAGFGPDAPPLPNVFTGADFYVAAYQHSFHMPEPGRKDRRAGLWTTIKSLNVPTTDLGKLA